MVDNNNFTLRLLNLIYMYLYKLNLKGWLNFMHLFIIIIQLLNYLTSLRLVNYYTFVLSIRISGHK